MKFIPLRLHANRFLSRTVSLAATMHIAGSRRKSRLKAIHQRHDRRPRTYFAVLCITARARALSVIHIEIGSQSVTASNLLRSVGVQALAATMHIAGSRRKSRLKAIHQRWERAFSWWRPARSVSFLGHCFCVSGTALAAGVPA